MRRRASRCAPNRLASKTAKTVKTDASGAGAAPRAHVMSSLPAQREPQHRS